MTLVASVAIERFRYDGARPSARLTAWTIPSPTHTYCPDKLVGNVRTGDG